MHQNCDPFAEDRNASAKEKFMKNINAVVQTQAMSFEMQDQILRFQDVVDISMENDFVYFPQFFEEAPPMNPPSLEYSTTCWKLTSFILQKMNSYHKKHGKDKSFKNFFEKLASV